jgi:enamine deaminase RidA (YjgF/YER057c/UK114 family)
MPRQIINTAEAPRPTAPISQAVRSGNLLFVSGITPFDLKLQLIKDDFAAQMRQTMKNLGVILKASDSDFSRVLKCTGAPRRLAAHERHLRGILEGWAIPGPHRVRGVASRIFCLR